MIVIADINAQTEILNVEAFGHTPWTMWGRLAEDKTAYSMNYRDVDPELLREADLVVLRVEETVWTSPETRPGLEEVSAAGCPRIAIIEGDMNGFRNWSDQVHTALSGLFMSKGVRMVVRDPRIVPYYEQFYPGTFFFSSLFEVKRLKKLLEDVRKENLIFLPYSTGIRGDRNGMLSAIMAQQLAEKHDCRVVMLQSQQNDALFCFKMGLDRIIALPYIEEMDRNALIAQSTLCVNLDTIPGFGKVAAEMACAKTFHLGCGTCGVTHYVWGHVSHSYLDYQTLFDLGDAVLENPERFQEDIDIAWQKVDDLDISAGRQKLKQNLGVDNL